MELKKSSINILILLRILIGWHFLHEGVSKILNPGWTSLGYLVDSQGPFSFIFHAMTKSTVVVNIADWMNVVGLTAIGLCLIIGILERPALIGGVILLAFYYLSHPPIFGMNYAMPSEGNYLFVDKNLIELVVMLLLYYVPTSHILGLKRIIAPAKAEVKS
ncbi:MAG: DoxX family membrane protein [Bacteroidota bacterium]|nr:DoxX family membrane protein [Bacteroidota bacterium]